MSDIYLRFVRGAGGLSPVGDRQAPPETKQEMVARWERNGWLVPDCPGCREFYDADTTPDKVFAPRHKAHDGCRSGKRPHCSCDGCF